VQSRCAGGWIKRLQRDGIAERVAAEMIARHGGNAAREATVKLNHMIDRGDIVGRDLWACVVHAIHEGRRG
jgi:hypothetical protein